MWEQSSVEIEKMTVKQFLDMLTDWDGHNFDGTPITDEQSNEAGLLTWDYKDYDEDGHMYVVLEQVEGEKKDGQ